MHPPTRNPLSSPGRNPLTATLTPHGLAHLASDLRRAHLDELAARVAAELDRGATAAAWARTRALETELDPSVSTRSEPEPPLPVIGRRFAAAHRRLLGRTRATDRPAASLECGEPAA